MLTQLQAEPWKLCFSSKHFAANHVVMLKNMLKIMQGTACPT